MRRREFLTGAAAALATGCSADTATSTISTNPPTSTLAGRTSVAVSTTAVTTAPLTSPDSGLDLGSLPFPYGVASGDPDDSSVVLWTGLAPPFGSPDLKLVCDVATDGEFEQLVVSTSLSAIASDHHTTKLVADGLRPNTTYWYRFRLGQHTSPTGRTRTLPTASTKRFRVAVSSCQERNNSALWDNHLSLAEEPDLGLVIWLGDFIYEQGDTTVDQYRNRYAEARGDQRLQASSSAHPWVCTWDDNEVANDYDASVDAQRRADAYQAWWEFMPTRRPRPSSNGLQVYRFFDVGTLLRIVLLDCRQYQTATTVLGAEQLEWLSDVVDHPAEHTLVGSPVVMSSLGAGGLTPSYSFEAHPDEQSMVIDSLTQAPQPVVVSGDLHAQMELELAPGIPELMAPPLSSAFPPEWANLLPVLPFVSESVLSARAANGYLLVEFTPEGRTHRFVT
jgi:alkaline phosphatase D